MSPTNSLYSLPLELQQNIFDYAYQEPAAPPSPPIEMERFLAATDKIKDLDWHFATLRSRTMTTDFLIKHATRDFRLPSLETTLANLDPQFAFRVRNITIEVTRMDKPTLDRTVQLICERFPKLQRLSFSDEKKGWTTLQKYWAAEQGLEDPQDLPATFRPGPYTPTHYTPAPFLSTTSLSAQEANAFASTTVFQTILAHKNLRHVDLINLNSDAWLDPFPLAIQACMQVQLAIARNSIDINDHGAFLKQLKTWTTGLEGKEKHNFTRCLLKCLEDVYEKDGNLGAVRVVRAQASLEERTFKMQMMKKCAGFGVPVPLF